MIAAVNQRSAFSLDALSAALDQDHVFTSLPDTGAFLQGGPYAARGLGGQNVASTNAPSLKRMFEVFSRKAARPAFAGQTLALDLEMQCVGPVVVDDDDDDSATPIHVCCGAGAGSAGGFGIPSPAGKAVWTRLEVERFFPGGRALIRRPGVAQPASLVVAGAA